MIRATEYKGRPAALVECGELCATFLPEDGGKLASLTLSGKEMLLTREGCEYKRLTLGGVYIDSECSAFDDMIPTVDPEESLGYRYLDHGDAARIAYEWEISENCLMLKKSSPMLPLSYEKRIEAAEGIKISYRIENHLDAKLPFLYAAHIMLRGEEGAKIITPFTDEDNTEMVFKTSGYSDGELSRDTLGKFSPLGAAYKFYYTEKIPEGRFAILYPDGCGIEFTYDKEMLPYLGIWFNNGEFQGIHNIAPEPCTAPFDSPKKALAKGYTAELSPREVFEFSINIRRYN